MRLLLIVVCISIFLTAGYAAAKDGFYVGGFYLSDSIASNDISGLGDGTGWGLRLGLGGKHFAAELSFFQTDHDYNATQEVELEGGTLDFKLKLPLDELDKIEPYALGGVGKYILKYPDKKYQGNVDQIYRYTEADGTVHDVKTSFLNGYQYGGGVDFQVTSQLCINAAYLIRRMYFDWGTPDNKELRASVRTTEIGLKYIF